MTGPATTAQWLAATGIGTTTTALVLAALKTALDGGRPRPYRSRPPVRRVPHLPACTPPRQPRHAADPPDPAETQPLRVRTRHARHSKDTTSWTR
ncbi:hypothetical protein [Streptomyces sp. NPDC048242]|uniref:hypothetical protein n=1 Tax=Streptomyces sp. NPDC048242 TaxID=3155026 RepID=UPI00343724B0